jgi:hypothetical protein
MAMCPLLAARGTGISGRNCNARASQDAAFYETDLGSYLGTIAYKAAKLCLHLGQETDSSAYLSKAALHATGDHQTYEVLR